MERNIKVFRAHRALSWLYLLIMGLFGAIVFPQPKVLKDPAFLMPIFILVALFLVHYLTARGAREAKPWARVSSIVISLLLLIGFPIGTIIGVYLLVNTWQPWPSNTAAVGAAT